MVKSCDEYELEIYHHLGRIAFKNDKILISDYIDKSIKCIDLTAGEIDTIKNEYKVQQPWSLCVNSKNETYFGDLVGNKIVVFDNDMKFKRDLEIPFKASNISFDLFDNKLYIAHWLNNQVTVCDEAKGLANHFYLDSPLYMEFSRDRVFIVSYTEYDTTTGTNNLLRIKKGANCIFVFNKNNGYEVETIIRFDTKWLAPVGLYIESNGNILTTAFKVDENALISKNRYLFIISPNGEIQREIELDGISNCNSMSFNRNKLVVSYDKYFKIIEFE